LRISPIIKTSSSLQHDVVQVVAANVAVQVGSKVAPAPVGGTLGKP
jgi:hypothetical protein